MLALEKESVTWFSSLKAPTVVDGCCIPESWVLCIDWCQYMKKSLFLKFIHFWLLGISILKLIQDAQCQKLILKVIDLLLYNVNQRSAKC